MKTSSPIAVIGVSAMFPDAANLQEYWKNIVQGHDAIRPIPVTHWKPEDLYDADPKRPDFTYAKTGGFLKPYDFDPLKFGIAPHALEATDTTQLLGMVCAHEALIDAGYGPGKDFNKERTSCIIGVTGTLELVIPLGARLSHPAWRKALKNAGVADEVAAEVMEAISESFVPWQENSFPGLLGNVVAGRIASRFDLGGSNAVVDAACASSLAALSMAVMELESGRADMVISGGMDTFNDIFMYMCFSKTPALSPTGHSRPFDADGDGTAIGEGLGALILKRLEDAERDGDRIYAVLKGVGSGSDGKGQAIYAPAAKGQIKALTRAYELADVRPETIELLEAHGTGTRVGDGVEISALAEVYPASDVKHCVIGSVKSQIGHTKAAAGAAGLIKAVMALHHKIQPPTLKVRALHAGLSKTPFQVLDQARPWITRGNYPRRAAISAFGFGGSNFHCVAEEYLGTAKPVAWDDSLYFFAFSGADRQDLLRKLSGLDGISELNAQVLARQSRRVFDRLDSCRLSFWARSLGEVTERVSASRDYLSGVRDELSDVAYFEGSAQTDLSLIFSGQGSQAVGMLRELVLAFPEALEPLEIGSRILREEETGLSLVDYIYPSQAFGDDKKVQQKALTATRIAQLALGSVGAALILVLQRFGVKATQFAGHSYGELLALYASGALKLEDMLRASYRRGLLMEKAGALKPGAGMLAVMASASVVEELLVGRDIRIANFNSAEQVVVGGALSELESLKAVLKGRGISSKALEVSTAFHTEFVSDAAAEFDQWLGENVRFSEPSVLVFGNRRAAAYRLEDMRGDLSGQLGSPVRFADMLNSMAAQNGTLVEVGPGRKLLGLLRAVNPQALSLDSEPRDSVLGLVGLLSQLAVRGFEVDLTAWYPGSESLPVDVKKSFTVSLTGANYRSPARAVVKKPIAAASPRDIAGAEALAASPRVVGKTGTVGVDGPRSFAGVKSLVGAGERSLADRTGLAVDGRAGAVLDNSRDAQVVPVSPLAVGVSLNKITHEASMNESHNWSGLEPILREMQEAQRRTTDAHTLFLENQRQFQGLLRDALLGGNSVTLASQAPRVSPSAVSYSPSTPYVSPDISGGQHAVPLAPSYNSTSQQTPSASSYNSSTQQTPSASQPTIATAKPANAYSSRTVPPSKSSAVAPAENKTNQQEIFQLIAEATGFPIEMLSSEMHLESDLGIDSIKKVEIFSQIQSRNPALKADATAMNEAQTIADLIQLIGPVSQPTPEDRQGAWSASPVAFASQGNERQAVLDVISDKTGFPTEMLQDEMDLEADLGVDSIKKVEIFSALSEKFPALASGGPNELHRIEDILRRLQPEGKPTQQSAGEQDLLWEVIAEKTGYPSEVLTLTMDLESDLGIDSIKRVEILSALTERRPDIKDKVSTEVRTLGDLLILLQPQTIKVHPRADDETLADSLLNPESSEWDLSAKKKSTESADERPRSDEHSVREHIRAQKVGCWKLKATAWAESATPDLPTDGEIWIADENPNSELAVSLSNEVKARGGQARLISISRLENHTTPDHLAALILIAPKNQDYSWYQNAYKLLQKSSAALTSSKGTFATISQLGGQFGLDALNSLDDCYAGGISALAKTIQHEWPEVTTRSIDLSFDFNDNTQRAARALDNVFKKGPLEIGVFAKRAITLKLSALTSTEQPPQKILNSGDTVLVTGGARGVTAATLKYLAKRYPVRLVIWGRTELPPEENANLNNLIEAATIKRQLLKNQPELAHPRDLERAYSQLISARELKGTLAELKAFGAEVIYEAVDVSNKDNLDRAFQSLQDRYPNIRGIIHGAGVLRDKIINDQSEDELQSVLSTKLTLLPYFEQLAKSGTQWMVFFSSSTARLGRKGQGAYGLANEILNRAASYLSTQYPTRVLSLNWGPWDGGMVNDGLKKLFASEGLGTIPLEAGAALQTYLLEHPSLGSGEWLVLGEGGEAILESHLITEDLILARRKVTIDETPVLLDHVIKNRAVVPAALLLEWMAQAAQPHYPNLKYVEAKNFQVFKGLVLDADSEVDIEIVGTHKGLVGMECILRSTSDSGMPRPHARVQLTFSETADERFTKISPYSVNDALERVEIYSKILFHGESLHLIKAIKHHDAHRLVAELRLQGEAKDWYQENHSWLTHAPLLDAVFQAAIVWSDLSLNSRCLPSRFDNAIFYQPWIPQDAILDLHIVSALDHQLKADAKVFGADGSLIADIRGFEATLDASLAESFRMRSLNVDRHSYDTQKDTE